MIKAWTGAEPYTASYRDVRYIGFCYQPTAFHFMVRADSEINTLEDLAGKKFGIGQPGSMAASGCKLVLEYAGLFDDIDTMQLTYGEMADMTANREFVGYNRSGSMGSAFVTQLHAQVPIKLLDLSSVFDNTKLLEEHPEWSKITIPAGTYDFQTEPITTLSSRSFNIVHKDVNEEDVYEYAKQIYSQECVDYLKVAFPKHAHWPTEKDPLRELLIPLHPGAEKFWQEAGVNIPEPTFTP
jgi:hypothetical protein